QPLTVSAQGTTVLDLYHDKSSWAPNADKVGEASAKAINIGFKSVPFPDTTTYQSTVRAALGSNKAPDLFTWWSGYRMEDIVKASGAEDLSAIWKKYLDSGEYSKGIADAYTFDGKVYAVPFNVAYWILFYNKSVFEKNSLSLPKTWKDFTALCDTLKGKGITPMAQTIDGRWPSFILFEELVARTAGPDFWNSLMSGKAAYDDAKVADALAMWKDMIGKGYFTDPGITMGTAENSMLPLFTQGKVAMLPIGDWYAATLVGGGMKPGTDYDAFIMPNPNADVPNLLFFETGPLLVSAKGARKEQALKVADWWMSADAQTLWDGLMGFSPANAKAQIDNPVSKNVAKQIADGKYQALQRYWEATPPDIVETAVDELGKFILKPDTAKEVLGAIQKKAEAVWKSRG
ncbi:MAG: extracellular solute-binding protein, partial [Anaerolineae bacterium]|nr:extracellular solute-binding protein [Anaerolineae bacterium]